MRVSDNTSVGAVNEALRRTRNRMEKLQIQNSTQKKLITPSDDPAGNAKIMDIRKDKEINSQFERNASIAKNRLEMTDSALGELYDLFVRAKEIAISQSSDASASADSRIGVAQEVAALYKQMVSIANRRAGQHYLFSGYKTLTEPYSPDGTYKGDAGEIPVEIQKDVFISMNVPGTHIFEVNRYSPSDNPRAPANVDRSNPSSFQGEEKLESPEGKPKIERFNPPVANRVNLFHELDSLRVGLMTNDTITIRDSLESLDEVIRSVITTRAKLSSRVSGIESAVGATQRADVQNAELATRLEDADYAELWSALAKEESVMRSSMQAAQKLIQPSLLEFLR